MVTSPGWLVHVPVPGPVMVSTGITPFATQDQVVASVSRLPMITSRKLVALVDPVTNDPIRHRFGSEGEVIGRGLLAYKHAFTDTTAFVDTLLVEAGSDNTFVQNDAGLSVAINKAFALKLSYQVRHNTDVTPGTKKTDQLMTTNLVYNFGG